MLTRKHTLTTACIIFIIALSLSLQVFKISANGVDTAGLSGSDFVYELRGGEERTFRVFVGGAVENEGFYTLPRGIFYYELFAVLSVGGAGSGFDLNSRINPDTPMIIIGYCLNVNVADFDDLRAITDEATARLIADYINENGSIEEKSRLKNVLTEQQYDAVKNFIYALII